MAANPHVAFRLAASNFKYLTQEQRERWIAGRDEVMLTALRAKLSNPITIPFAGKTQTLAQWLLDTGGMPLVHIEHLSTQRQAIDNAPPYWGAHQKPNSTRVVIDEAGNEQVVPSDWHGTNRLGQMLMQLRTELRQTGGLTAPQAVVNNKIIDVEELPPRVRRALEALGINAQHLYTNEWIRFILSRINQGNLVLSVGGGRTDVSAQTRKTDSNENWVNLTSDEIRQRKVKLATDKGWISDESQWNIEIESRVDTYNRTQAEGADAAFAVGEALSTQNGVLVSGGAAGTDIKAIEGNVGKGRKKNRGGASIAVLPGGIKKRMSPWGQMRYEPNVYLLDKGKNLAAISLHPENYDPNQSYSERGSSSYISNLHERNGVVAALGHVFFATHANDYAEGQGSGTVDAALKALAAGRPVVVMDPTLFDSPLEGSEYLATLPNVYVLKHRPNFPLFEDAVVNGQRTRTWNGANILYGIQMIAEFHNPELVTAMPSYVEYSEAQLKDRIRELHDAASTETEPFARLRIQSEVKTLNLIRAERHPSPSRTSPVDFEYVTQLDPAERRVTGALIGLRNYNSFGEFYSALKDSGVKVFVDVRQNTWEKARDEKTGAMVNDWTHGSELQAAFQGTDIAYVSAAQFTPETATRRYQQIIDSLTNISKMKRGALDAGFTAAYHDFLRETKADLGMFIKNTIAMNVGYQNVNGSAICFGCVEFESEACHRSMLGEIMHDVLGLSVLDVHAGGASTPYHPGEHTHSHGEALPLAAYPGKSKVAVSESNKAYIPKHNSMLEMVGYQSDEQGNAVVVAYRHVEHPGYELEVRRASDGTIEFYPTFPETEETELIRREAEIETELGARPQATPFLSGPEVIQSYKNTSMDSETIPEIAEHVFRAISPSINTPEIYENTEDIASAPDNPLVPFYQGGRLKHRIVMTIPRREGLEFSRERRRVGERVVTGAAHQTADEDQSITIVDEGQPFGERQQPTEHETYHYSWRETPDVEVRLSPSGKYLSALVPRGKKIRVPSDFQLNVRVHQSWEEFNGSVYEFLHANPHLWHTVNAEGFPLRKVPRGVLPPTVDNLPAHIREAVYGSTSARAAASDWELIKSFMARRTGQSEAEQAAALRFAERVPAPPNILTQVRRYLTAVHKATNRLDPTVDTVVTLPEFDEYKPRKLNAGGLNEQTGQAVGDTAESIDPEIEGGEQVLSEQMEQAELEEVEPEESEDADLEGAIAAADEESEEREISEARQDVAEMTASAGAAGIPFPSEVGAELTVRDSQIEAIQYSETGHYAPQWYEYYQNIMTMPENGFDSQWEDGTLRVRATVFANNRPTTEERKAGLNQMVRDLNESLLNLMVKPGLADGPKARIQGIQERLKGFMRSEGFNDLDLWSETSQTLKSFINTLRDSYSVMGQVGGADFVSNFFTLKGHPLTNLPIGGTLENGNTRKVDVILTNTGQLVPIQEMNQYVVDPNLKQVIRRPDTQLNMIIDQVQETDADTGETSPVTRFFADNNRHGQEYEVINETDNEVEVNLVGSDYSLRFSKEDRGRVVLENRAIGGQSPPIFIENWKDVPLNTTNTTRQSIAPIAMAMKHGFFTNTGNVPLGLYHIDMLDEGTWSYNLNDSVSFDHGSGRLVRSDNYKFTVSVVPTEVGFVYNVSAFNGEIDANIFRDLNGVQTNTVNVFMARSGVPIMPHEAILEMMWQQREVAIEQGWELPPSASFPVTQEVDYSRPPELERWDSASELDLTNNPNDIYFEPWDRWASEIRNIYGEDVVRSAERAIFESDTPLYTRHTAMFELEQATSDVTESPERLRRLLELAVPGILREHLNAQSAFVPTDPKFVEQNSNSPVIRRYRHSDHSDYVVDLLEGSGIAEVMYQGVSIGEIDYREANTIWEAMGRDFHSIVEEHSTKRQTNGRYKQQTTQTGESVWVSTSRTDAHPI